jgi:hypothetical protein
MARGKKRLRQLKDLPPKEQEEIRDALLSGKTRGMEVMEMYGVSTYLFWQQLATELGIRYQKAASGKRTDGTYVVATTEEVEQARRDMGKLVANQSRRKKSWVERHQHAEAPAPTTDEVVSAAHSPRIEPDEEPVEDTIETPTEYDDDEVEAIETIGHAHDESANVVETQEFVVAAVEDEHEHTLEDIVAVEERDVQPSERPNLISYRFAEEPLFDQNDMQAIMESLDQAKQALRAANTRLEELVLERDEAIKLKQVNEADYMRMLVGYDQLQRDLEVYKRSHSELTKIRNLEKLRQVNQSKTELDDLISRTQKFVEDSRMIKVPTSSVDGNTK